MSNSTVVLFSRQSSDESMFQEAHEESPHSKDGKLGIILADLMQTSTSNVAAARTMVVPSENGHNQRGKLTDERSEHLVLSRGYLALTE
jgi:hypothetical protein